jgi:hypothetical protein
LKLIKDSFEAPVRNELIPANILIDPIYRRQPSISAVSEVFNDKNNSTGLNANSDMLVKLPRIQTGNPTIRIENQGRVSPFGNYLKSTLNSKKRSVQVEGNLRTAHKNIETIKTMTPAAHKLIELMTESKQKRYSFAQSLQPWDDDWVDENALSYQSETMLRCNLQSFWHN